MRSSNEAVSVTEDASKNPVTSPRRRAHRSAQGSGTIITFLGLVLQLIGLSWDSRIHQVDPGLASREGVFTIANPSHLLFLLGLGLTVGGVCASLWISSARSSSRSGLRRLVPVTGSVALLGLLVTTGGIGVSASAGLLGVGHHDDAAAAGHVHAQTTISATLEPVLASLQQVVRASGTEQALVKLAVLADTDSAVAAHTHPLAHSLGRYSFGLYGTAAVALQHCTPAFESGCYHGVLEAYFDGQPQVQPQQLGALCASLVGPNATTFLTFECLHGLGHGIMANVGDDLHTALTYCDYLGQEWDRNSCYGGVFMENLMVEYDRRCNPSQASGLPTLPSVEIVRENDPLYPCDSVQEKYLQSCYELQSSIILMLNGSDFGMTARTCETAPPQWSATCFRSIGRDAAGYVGTDYQRAADICLLANSAHRPDCFAGAAQTIATESANIGGSLAFCRLAPAESKPACYTATGEFAATLFADSESATRECSAAEDGYAEVCRVAAARTI